TRARSAHPLNPGHPTSRLLVVTSGFRRHLPNTSDRFFDLLVTSILKRPVSARLFRERTLKSTSSAPSRALRDVAPESRTGECPRGFDISQLIRFYPWLLKIR